MNWTFLHNYTIPISGLTRTWAPEWFIDTDGSVNVNVSPTAASTATHFTAYTITAANAALTTWSTPIQPGIGPNYMDTFIVKVGSTYHAFTKNETMKYIEYATASSLAGPYTLRKTGNWAGGSSFKVVSPWA
ncbi:hypothetical protein ACFV83_15525 [Streptomyces pharetrae]|uniref:hypothetical protein n=1 Tax=Streptomyces pharetrae TaxID=291370 RepID=UPI0036549772